MRSQNEETTIFHLLQRKIEIKRHNIFHFKAFDMINLHYEIRICQKIYNRVTTDNKSKCLVRNRLHQMLVMAKLGDESNIMNRLILQVSQKSEYIFGPTYIHFL